MPSRKLEHDEPFFREWRSRAKNEKRSLGRAARLMELLGLNDLSLPVLAVVGSKGKGTTALYASATLAGAGFKVGTQTSPPIIDNRERIRVNGAPIDETAYADLSNRLSTLLDQMPADNGDGYLSPTGLFTLMGVRHMIDQGCDALVLEAGIGGTSDEISLFSPTVVAVARIFSEHADIIGPTIMDIAEDKIGIVTPSTKSIFSVAQSSDVRDLLERRAHSTGSALSWVSSDEPWESLIINASGLSKQNAWLGVRSGWRLAEIIGATPRTEQVDRVLQSILTPGRLSVHSDEQNRTWVVDACIDGVGAAAALEFCRAKFGVPTTIFVAVPDGKDISGVSSALGDYPFIPVKMDEEHLTFSDLHWGCRLVSIQSMSLYERGNVILAIGTWSFVGSVLDRLRVTAYNAFGVSVEA